MSTQISIVDGPLPPAPLPVVAGAGALLVFEGIVRAAEPLPDDPHATIEALDYQAYEPMAQTMIVRLGDELIARHGLLGIFAVHSKGRVPVGGCSFRLTIAAEHRKEALAAMDEFIDRLKRDVPIWKHPVWKSP